MLGIVSIWARLQRSPSVSIACALLKLKFSEVQPKLSRSATQLLLVAMYTCCSPGRALRAKAPVLSRSGKLLKRRIRATAQAAAASDAELSGYRMNVGVCLINKQGLVFAAQRVGEKNNYWQMPQGGVDEGEDLLAAALRELREETGVTSVRMLKEHAGWLKYDFPPEVLDNWPAQWTRHKGQAQRWFLLAFEGQDSEIDLMSQDIEFETWQWMPFEELLKAVWPVKLPVYASVYEAFADDAHLHAN